MPESGASEARGSLTTEPNVSLATRMDTDDFTAKDAESPKFLPRAKYTKVNRGWPGISAQQAVSSEGKITEEEAGRYQTRRGLKI